MQCELCHDVRFYQLRTSSQTPFSESCDSRPARRLGNLCQQEHVQHHLRQTQEDLAQRRRDAKCGQFPSSLVPWRLCARPICFHRIVIWQRYGWAKGMIRFNGKRKSRRCSSVVPAERDNRRPAQYGSISISKPFLCRVVGVPPSSALIDD